MKFANKRPAAAVQKLLRHTQAPSLAPPPGCENNCVPHTTRAKGFRTEEDGWEIEQKKKDGPGVHDAGGLLYRPPVVFSKGTPFKIGRRLGGRW